MDLPVSTVVRPATIEQAIEAFHQNPKLVPVAGGTDVVVQLRSGRLRADVLLDVSDALPSAVEMHDEHLEIGAGSNMDTIARSGAVQNICPALSEAAGKVGAWPIQCRATLAGNLGNASPAADTAPPLITAGAEILVASKAGERRIPAEELMTGPGATSLKAGELIRAVRLPVVENARRFSRFVKLGWQYEQVISVVSVAVCLHIADDDTIEHAAVAFGAVAPTPVRAPFTENHLVSFKLCEATRMSAVEECQRDISPIDDVRAPAWYRRIAAATLLDRLLVEAEYA